MSKQTLTAVTQKEQPEGNFSGVCKITHIGLALLSGLCSVSGVTFGASTVCCLVEGLLTKILAWRRLDPKLWLQTTDILCPDNG